MWQPDTCHVTKAPQVCCVTIYNINTAALRSRLPPPDCSQICSIMHTFHGFPTQQASSLSAVSTAQAGKREITQDAAHSARPASHARSSEADRTLASHMLAQQQSHAEGKRPPSTGHQS